MDIVARWLGILTINLLLVASCAQVTGTPTQVPTETPTPLPTHTPRPMPSPTAIFTTSVTPTPTIGPSPTPVIVLQPTPTRERNSNIAPFTPRNWVLPLFATGTPGQNTITELSVGGATYISWAVINNSRSSIEHSFFVDVYLDDVFVERWQSPGLEANQLMSVTGWEKLPARVRLQSGTHRLKLVVDPTDLIPETDESDNVFVSEFTWEPLIDGTPVVAPDRIKLPDMVPSVPNGWSDSLIATSYSGDKADGPLSVNVPTYISYGFQNRGLASFEGEIRAHLYLDDILVSAQVGDGLLAEETAGSSQWAGLFGVINVTPGEHILRIEVDPTDLIIEADESNNVIEKRFIWGTGGVPPKPSVVVPIPAPTPPAPLTLPNLVPGWRLDWDGPIIASREIETFLNDPLGVDNAVFVDVILHNESIIEVSTSFSVDLYFDDRVVHTFEVSESMEPNQLLLFADWDELTKVTQITEGVHTLRMVIDPANAVAEADEDDNVYEVEIEWVDGIAGLQVQTVYTTQELRQKLADLQTLIDTREPALSADGIDHTEEVLRVADAGYYVLTGRSLLDERVDIYLLNRKDYLAWIDDYYSQQFALNGPVKYADLLAEREKIKMTAAGLKISHLGKIAVVVDAERDIADVIGSLAHEVGHMRQTFLNPSQDDGAYASFQHRAVQEAQAQQFERAFWLKLEEFTGLTLVSYPDYQGFRDLIGDRFDSWYADINRDEHFLGYLIQWLVVLDDPNLADMKQELIVQKRLGAESSLRLYDYLVSLDAEHIQEYIIARVQALDTYAEIIKAISRGRLIFDMLPDEEGSPDLRKEGLLAP